MILNTFRFNIDGREIASVEIDQILANEEDRKLRKKAYFARNQINKSLVDGGFIELINLRKELAKAYGSKDFVKYRLEKNELSPDIFNNWDVEIKEHVDVLNAKRRKYANQFLNKDEMLPWDEEYIRSQISPPSLNATVDMSNFYNVIRDFFINFGIDIDEYNITYDIFPRKKTNLNGDIISQ